MNRLDQFDLRQLYLLAWLIPMSVVAFQIMPYTRMHWHGFLSILCSVIASYLFMPKRKINISNAGQANNKKLFNLAIILCAISLIGNYLSYLSYKNSGIDINSGLQEAYISVLEQASNDRLQTGLLGSISQLCRIAVPFFIICAIILANHNSGIFKRFIIVLLFILTLASSYLTNFSRGQLLFYAVTAFITLLTTDITKKRKFYLIILTALIGMAFYSWSAVERASYLDISQSVRKDIISDFFGLSDSIGSEVLIAIGGPELLGLIAYFTHSTVEGARLIENGYSPYFLGFLSFFPYFNPVNRLFGGEFKFDFGEIDRINYWYSAVGEFFLDFGYISFIIFIMISIWMYKFAIKHLKYGFWGQFNYIITGVFFALFPLYSVFQSYGLIYATSIMLVLISRMRFPASNTKSDSER